MDIIDLGFIQLAIAFLALLAPLFIFYYYRTGLITQLGISALRMVLQLFFVGFYMEVLFELDNPWITGAWILVMVIASDIATNDRSNLKLRVMFWPVFAATLLGIVLIDLFFLEAVIQLPEILEPRYTIPITGMILGNCLKTNVIGLQAFYSGLRRHHQRYEFDLMCGARRNEALFPFYRDALRKAANPILASMATVGLVSFPGMMTGQILGGATPFTAIRYQIMIHIAIFSGTILTVFLAIWFCNRRAFHANDQLDTSIFKGGLDEL